MLSYLVADFLGERLFIFFDAENLDNAYTYREIVRGNPENSSPPHIDSSKLASESSKLLDHRRVLSIPNFRKCEIFVVENLKFLKSCTRNVATQLARFSSFAHNCLEIPSV